jgi:hypothetical protein
MDASFVWLLQPAATACGILVAVFAIRWNRHVVRLKATLDLIEGSESKEYDQARYRAFRQYRRGGDYRDRVLDPQGSREAQEERDKCLDFLNHDELVSIACSQGIIDENFYRRWMGPAYVRDWNQAVDLVRAARVPRRPGDAGGRHRLLRF